MAGWKQASDFLKAALIILTFAFLIFLIGFSTESWMTKIYTAKSKITFGLFVWKIERYQVLNYYLGDNRPDFEITRTDWFRATQAMECLGLLCMAIALLILFLYFFVSQCKRRNAMIAIIIFTFASVIFIVIGVAVFATKFEDRGYDISWSMGLAIAGAVFAFVAGVMELIELR